MKNLHLILGNITQAKVDIIVNAANTSLMGGGGVDGALHQAAGTDLIHACKELPNKNGIRCPTGEARITPAGKLNSNYVIHTVGPQYHLDSNPKQLLQSAYEATLNLALGYPCKSIAFPAISCGAYQYPIKEASSIAIQTCIQPKYKILNIYFYLFDKETFSIYQDSLNQYHYSEE